jgi:CRP-like cAMP-binding protein
VTEDGAVHEDFLAVLDADEQRTLRERGTVRKFAKGAALFHAGQESDRVLVVLTGHVKLVRATDDGREVMLALRGPGELLGEQSAIDGDARSASAVAIEPVEALAVATPDFLSFVSRTPTAAMFVMKLLSSRLRDADRKRLEFSAQDSVGRLASRLVELCEAYGEKVEEGLKIDLPLTQEDLAGWTGSSREAVSRALQQLRGLGWVETGRRSITVLDVDALRKRVS